MVFKEFFKGRGDISTRLLDEYGLWGEGACKPTKKKAFHKRISPICRKAENIGGSTSYTHTCRPFFPLWEFLARASLRLCSRHRSLAHFGFIFPSIFTVSAFLDTYWQVPPLFGVPEKRGIICRKYRSSSIIYLTMFGLYNHSNPIYGSICRKATFFFSFKFTRPNCDAFPFFMRAFFGADLR